MASEIGGTSGKSWTVGSVNCFLPCLHSPVEWSRQRVQERFYGFGMLLELDGYEKEPGEARVEG